VRFRDESREIACEYEGGLSSYAVLDLASTPPHDPALECPSQGALIDIDVSKDLPTPLKIRPGKVCPSPKDDSSMNQDHGGQHSHTNSEAPNLFPGPPTAGSNPGKNPAPPNKTYSYLSNPEEVFYLQVFVEEVGLWMDSMDSMKHFSRILPFSSLDEPMLLNAFLACGARHLSMVNPIYQEDRALYYYDTATTQLLRALQNPDRDTGLCATAAVILNVYEIMSERALQRMNHIAGARALIKECGWSARSTGIGAACFWLNVGMEFLSCLHFNWQVAWDPDQWGVDMDFQREIEPGHEEIWVHRILCISAKIANFRASIPRFQEPSPHHEQIRLQNRYAEWQRLKALCDDWNNSVPRTMHPMANIHSYQTKSKSAFPEIWLVAGTAPWYHVFLLILYYTGCSNALQSLAESSTIQL
jgi:hypothetical protein